MRQLLSGCFAQLFHVAILLNANSSNVLNTVSIKGPLKSGTNGQWHKDFLVVYYCGHISGNNPGSRIPNCRLLECRLQNALCPNASNVENSCFNY